MGGLPRVDAVDGELSWAYKFQSLGGKRMRLWRGRSGFGSMVLLVLPMRSGNPGSWQRSNRSKRSKGDTRVSK